MEISPKQFWGLSFSKSTLTLRRNFPWTMSAWIIIVYAWPFRCLWFGSGVIKFYDRWINRHAQSSLKCCDLGLTQPSLGFSVKKGLYLESCKSLRFAAVHIRDENGALKTYIQGIQGIQNVYTNIRITCMLIRRSTFAFAQMLNFSLIQ